MRASLLRESIQDLKRVNSRHVEGDVVYAAVVCYGASNKQAYYGTKYIYILYGTSCFDCIFQMN